MTSRGNKSTLEWQKFGASKKSSHNSNQFSESAVAPSCLADTSSARQRDDLGQAIRVLSDDALLGPGRYTRESAANNHAPPTYVWR
ncbi:uncharacterized protein ISCGN_023508 [Ixodes scapularis]